MPKSVKPDKEVESNYGYGSKINICLIGPSGVGKTSLLATMYKTLQIQLGKAFRFEPLNKGAFQVLSEKYVDLQKMLDKPAYTRLTSFDRGTPKITEYAFGLDLLAPDGKRSKLVLIVFIDTPGGMSSRLDDELEKRIRDSHIIINAIDAGAMMKADVLKAEEYNGYGKINFLLENNYFTTPGNKLVIFTLIKSETWIRERDNPKHVASDVNYLLRKFHEQCQCLIDLFPEAAPRLGIFCPVETLGCVEFSMVTKDDDGDQLVHYKRMFGKKFSPRHVHLPLYFALRFALVEWCKNKNFLGRLFSKVFGVYNEVVASLEKLDAEAVANIVKSPVEPLMYGNKKLLEK